jgi:hypothetical protein
VLKSLLRTKGSDYWAASDKKPELSIPFISAAVRIHNKINILLFGISIANFLFS